MNCNNSNNSNSDAQIARDMSLWGSVEAQLVNHRPLQVDMLKRRLHRKQKSTQRAALGLLSLACVAAVLLIYSRPQATPTIEDTVATLSPDPNNNLAETLTSERDDLVAQLQRDLASAEDRNRQLQTQLERLSDELELLWTHETHHDPVERYQAAVRQRARERVFDQWLAKNQ